MTTTSTKYSKLSYSLTKEISKTDKKEQGIYFTPPKTIHTIIKCLEPYINEFQLQYVLEPSCGTNEFIFPLQKFQHLNIDAIEKNQLIYDSIKHMSNSNLRILNEDFLKATIVTNYDFIVGNPPYFVMKKDEVDKSFYGYFDGRPNIFILFIIKSLGLLKENGILAFVLPQNFLNCLYYNKTRQYINNHFTILHILECDDEYLDTKQKTIIVIIQKKKDTNETFTLEVSDYTLFGTEASIVEIKDLYANSTSLSALGFEVNVGTVVWNQCKKILTDDSTKPRLIYSSDISDKKLTFKTYSNNDKKNYIDKKGETGPLLVINRGYGVGNYNFEYCLIDCESEYLIENHLICIRYTSPTTHSELMVLYNKIIQSFSNEKTKKFISLYFGNNAINTVELNHILPIYDI